MGATPVLAYLRNMLVVLASVLCWTSCQPISAPPQRLPTPAAPSPFWEEVMRPTTLTPNCTPAAQAQLDQDTTPIAIRCNLYLSARSIHRTLIIEGNTSHITLDCQGGAIYAGSNQLQALIIRSQPSTSQATSTIQQVPHHILIKNCTFYGAIRIYGLGQNGEALAVKESSQHEQHTQHAQQAAPHHIVIYNSVIHFNQNIGLYISPGVHHVALLHSEIRGGGKSVALYLDAESAHNAFVGNLFSAQSTTREQVAIDGSAYNTFMYNVFMPNHLGGIYVYRNCGEGGTVRHQMPQYNQLAHNIFVHNTLFPPLSASVFLGSRQGKRTYCQADQGYNFGSSIDNTDQAHFNSVTHTIVYNPYHTMFSAIKNHGKNTISDTIVLTPPRPITTQWVNDLWHKQKKEAQLHFPIMLQ